MQILILIGWLLVQCIHMFSTHTKKTEINQQTRKGKRNKCDNIFYDITNHRGINVVSMRKKRAKATERANKIWSHWHNKHFLEGCQKRRRNGDIGLVRWDGEVGSESRN